MPYDIKEEELYNRAFFSFRYLVHLINLVFEPYDEPEYPLSDVIQCKKHSASGDTPVI